MVSVILRLQMEQTFIRNKPGIIEIIAISSFATGGLYFFHIGSSSDLVHRQNLLPQATCHLQYSVIVVLYCISSGPISTFRTTESLVIITYLIKTYLNLFTRG